MNVIRLVHRIAPPPPRAGVAVLFAVSVAAACDSPPLEPSLPEVGPPLAAVTGLEPDLVLDDVELRPGTTADIHLKINVNPTRPCRDPARVALLVHGVNHTAASWDSFAEAFLRGHPQTQLCLLAAMDHAGHGASGLPEGPILFGELAVEDYARTLLEVLERLQEHGIRPSILMGHSQGTSTIQTAQEMLLDRGENLRDRFEIRDAVFMGIQGPAEVPTGFLLPDEVVAGIVASLVTTTPERGTFVQGPPSIFQQLWFSNLDLALSSEAPSVAEISALGWSSDVPLVAVLQGSGQGGLTTPSVRGGAFHPRWGTRLLTLDFADDPWSLTPEARDIHAYLTEDGSPGGFVTLADPDGEAVHDYLITHPDIVREALSLPRTRAYRSRR